LHEEAAAGDALVAAFSCFAPVLVLGCFAASNILKYCRFASILSAFHPLTCQERNQCRCDTPHFRLPQP
jgi:hypothetical protein